MSDIKEFHILQIEDCVGSKIVCLKASAYSIGRDSESNAIVVADPLVSRNHALLFRISQPEGTFIYRLVDGDSAGNPSMNGLSVNNKPCSERCLQTGDQIFIGQQTRLTYLLARMTQEEFEQYFGAEELTFHSILGDSVDPTFTMILERSEDKGQF